MWETFIDWLEANQFSCMWRWAFGSECPGCGMQRSFLALMRGDLALSLSLWPALLPMLGMFIYLLLHLKLKFKRGGLVLRYWSFAVMAIILTNYLWKHAGHWF